MLRSSALGTSSALSACALLLVSCGGGGSASTSMSMSTLNLGLTDAPVSGVTKVWIQFTGVEVKPASGNPIDFMFSPDKGFDLLSLQGGATAIFLNGTTVPPGQYEWVRLMVDTKPGASYVMDSTGQHDLTIPSGAETGLKLVQGFTMPVGGVANFTVDFVLSKSLIAPQGLSPDYLLKPVLRLVDNTQVGTISGTFQASTLSNPLNTHCGTRPPVVYVYTGANVQPDDIYNATGSITDTDTDPASAAQPLTTATAALNSMNDYAYSIAFLPSGNYTVAFTCDPDDPAVDESATSGLIHFVVFSQAVAVTANMTTTVNF
jgi:hypothetical protein